VNDLHETFRTWLVAGARDGLPRDVALHASACPDCLRTVAAFDALAGVDPGAAPEPALIAPATRFWTPRTLLVVRGAAGVAAVALIAAAGFVAAGGLFGPPPDALTAAQQSPQGEGVLGNQGGPSASATASETATVTESASATVGPSASAEPIPQDNPPMGGGPPPVSTLRPTPTPRPTTAPTARPTAVPTVAPTPQPSLEPTPVATPPPTPTPEPTPTPVESVPAP
jgi:hypothetical protein